MFLLPGSRYSWPMLALSKNAQALFRLRMLSSPPLSRIRRITATDFTTSFLTDLGFVDYWNRLCQEHPEQNQPLCSLLNGRSPFIPSWLTQLCKEYIIQTTFKSLSEAERLALQREIESLRQKIYQDALKKEARRLGCQESEICPNVPILPLTFSEGESKLVDLPSSIFVKILNKLESADIFRITLVCKRWKQHVYDNPKELKCALHSTSNHLISFREWLNTSEGCDFIAYRKRYKPFTWGLIRWYTAVSNNLQSLILDIRVSPFEVARLLDHCPNLKCLQLQEFEILCYSQTDSHSNVVTNLPRLEIFIVHCFPEDNSLKLISSILNGTPELKVYAGPFVLENWVTLTSNQFVEKCLMNLIALQLTYLSEDVLVDLECIGHLKLKYFRLGRITSNQWDYNYEYLTRTTRSLVHVFLSKMTQLEVLIIEENPGIVNSTLQCLTDLKLNLKFAVFWEPFIENGPQYNEWLVDFDRTVLEVDSVVAFENMVLENYPNTQLANYTFVVGNDARRANFVKAGISLTFFERHDQRLKELVLGTELRDSEMRRKLGLTW